MGMAAVLQVLQELVVSSFFADLLSRDRLATQAAV